MEGGFARKVEIPHTDETHISHIFSGDGVSFRRMVGFSVSENLIRQKFLEKS